MDPVLHIVLYEPEIPQNTGNIGRLCLGLGARLHLIHPLGFDIDEKAVRRAGLDYWKHVDLQQHASADHFWDWAQDRRVFALSTKAEKTAWSPTFRAGDVLLLGPETRGLPLGAQQKALPIRIPIKASIRSLNLANATAIIAYRAMSQIQPDWFSVAD